MAEAEETIGVEQAREAIAGGEAKALDIRDEEEWSGAHVPGAIHLPAEQLDSGIDELDFDSEQRLVVFASDESAGKEAVSTLREKGFEASVVKGGVEKWGSEDFRLQPTEDADPED